MGYFYQKSFSETMKINFCDLYWNSTFVKNQKEQVAWSVFSIVQKWRLRIVTCVVV